MAAVAEKSTFYRFLAFGVIVCLGIYRILYLLYLCPYDLSQDEAHYWDWSRHLDWSYYSKGPLVAWIIRAGCELFGPASIAIEGSLMPAIRIPAVIFGCLTLAALYLLMFQTYRSDRLAFGVICIAITIPSFFAVSVVMTIDAPFLSCWIWALVFGRWAAIDGKAWAWPCAGLCVALGILAKYTMALWFGSFVLFLLFTPAYRRILFSRGFWIMTAFAALSALPILYWNSQNDWVTFRHVAVQAGVAKSPKNTGIQVFGPFSYFGEQFVPLFGFWFVAWFLAIIHFRPSRETDPNLRYFWWMSIPTFALFGAASLAAKVQINWPVASYMAGGVLAAGWYVQVGARYRLVRIAAIVAVVFGGFLTILVHDTTRFVLPVARPYMKPETAERPTPARSFDMTARMKGWRYLASELDRIRAEIRTAEGKEPFLAGLRWDYPGIMGCYCEGKPQAYTIGIAIDDRHSQYDLWHPNPVGDPNEFRGRTFIIVGFYDPKDLLKRGFNVVDEPREIVYRENGMALARWYVRIARDYRGFDASSRTVSETGH